MFALAAVMLLVLLAGSADVVSFSSAWLVVAVRESSLLPRPPRCPSRSAGSVFVLRVWAVVGLSASASLGRLWRDLEGWSEPVAALSAARSEDEEVCPAAAAPSLTAEGFFAAAATADGDEAGEGAAPEEEGAGDDADADAAADGEAAFR